MNIEATRAHIDAETMAAWADRALPADAAAAVELHLSNCGRCQEVLAAFVRSAPQAGAVVLPFWARRPVQWSAAGLAAAAALVTMIWIGRPPAVPVPESTSASASAPQSVDQLQDTATAEKPASVGEPRREIAAANRALAKKVESREATVAPPPPPPAAVAAPAVTAPAITTPAPQARVGVGGGISGRAASEAFAADAISVIVPTFEIAAPDPKSPSQRLMTQGAGRGAVGAASAVSPLSQSAGPTRWRVVEGIRVERSLDAGATWIPLPIEPSLTTTLRAGVATSQSNCWLVGGDGVVLVTHDGQTFRRVSVPEAVPLTAVTATDGMRAVVTTIDGRTFSTIDGGLTWK